MMASPGVSTYLLEIHGWAGVLGEPSQRKPAEACSRARPGSVVVNKAAIGNASVDSIDFFEVSRGAAGERFDGISAVGSPSVLLQSALAAGSHVEQTRVPASTLDSILEEAKFDGEIDLLSIDVEGYELQVLRGLALDRNAPRLIILEDNAFGPESDIPEYLGRFGYRRVGRSFVNDWYAAPEVEGCELSRNTEQV